MANNPLGEKDRWGKLIDKPSTAAADAIALKTRRQEGKVSVCMASSIGIGYAIARRLAQEGSAIVLCSRKQEQVDAAVKQLKSEGFQADGMAVDVTNDDHMAAFTDFVAKKHGRCDNLLLNQSRAFPSPLLKHTKDEWVKEVRTNLESRWWQVKTWKENGLLRRGSAVLMMNGGGAYHPSPFAGGFYVCETGLTGLTVLLARELGPDGIRVNAIAPGPVRTKFASDLWTNDKGQSDPEAKAAKDMWLGRIGEPTDIAGAAAFLCSDDASWLTGQTMAVDGGTYTRL